MSPALQLFVRIFCMMGLVGFGIGTVLAASSAPAQPPLVVAFGAVTALMAAGIYLMRRRVEL